MFNFYINSNNNVKNLKKSEKKEDYEKKYASCCFFVYLEYFSCQHRRPEQFIPTSQSRHQNPLPSRST